MGALRTRCFTEGTHPSRCTVALASDVMTTSAMLTFASLQAVDSIKIRFAWLIAVRSRVTWLTSAVTTDHVTFRAVITLAFVSTVWTPLLRRTLEATVPSPVVISTLAFIRTNAHTVLALWITNGKTLFSVLRLPIAWTTNGDAFRFLYRLKK